MRIFATDNLVKHMNHKNHKPYTVKEKRGGRVHFLVSEDLEEFLNSKGNKSQYLNNLIRKDYEESKHRI